MDLRGTSLRYLPFRARSTYNENPDGFIPNRFAMDMDYAKHMIMEARNDKKNAAPTSPMREAYLKNLREVLNLNRTGILAFKNKPPSPKKSVPSGHFEFKLSKPVKSRRHIPQNLETTLDVPDIIDDYCLNLLD